MILSGSTLSVADNTGAKKVRCIRVLGGTNKNFANIGDMIVVSIKQVIANHDKKVVLGAVHYALVVRTKKGVVRADGSRIKFIDNSVILIDKNKELLGTRVFGAVPLEIKLLGYTKLVSLAEEVF